MSALPVGEPRVTEETEPFWSATAQGRIDLPVCDLCGLVIWYPRSFCPDCQSDEVSWATMAGTGTVYSYTVTRRGVGSRWRDHLPIVVAYVQLDEGPIMLTNIVDTDPESVEIDMPVVAVFDRGEEHTIVRFRSAG